MTNKELAELKADIIKLVKQYDGVDISKMIEFDKKLESILSEYQGEAVGEIIAREFKETCIYYQFVASLDTDIDLMEKVYLSAPLKKEENNESN